MTEPKIDRSFATDPDRNALRDLADAYGIGVDRRDADLLASLFTDDAVLVVYNPRFDTPWSKCRGIEQIRGIAKRIAKYFQTMHFVGNQRVTIDSAAAVGITYCFAHHITAGTTVDIRISIRPLVYHDRFERGNDGRWRFTRRENRRQWVRSISSSFQVDS